MRRSVEKSLAFFKKFSIFHSFTAYFSLIFSEEVSADGFSVFECG